MFGVGLQEIVILAIIVAIIFIVKVVSKGRRGINAKIILEEFTFNENSNEFLIIKGRASGFRSWVLSLFNRAPKNIFSCNKQELKYETKIKHNIPLAKITCVSSGMQKSSIMLLVLGIIFILFGQLIPLPFVFRLFIYFRLLFGFVIGVILIIIYSLNRKILYFGICVGENKPMITIQMKRGITKSIDKTNFELAFNTINMVVLENIRAKTIA